MKTRRKYIDNLTKCKVCGKVVKLQGLGAHMRSHGKGKIPEGDVHTWDLDSFIDDVIAIPEGALDQGLMDAIIHDNWVRAKFLVKLAELRKIVKEPS